MMYDMHMHTTNSDGRNTVDEMCGAAIEKGVSGIAFTDHADMNFYEERNTFERIKAFLGPWPRALEAAGLKGPPRGGSV